MDGYVRSLRLYLHLAILVVTPVSAEQEDRSIIKKVSESELSQLVAKSNQSNITSINVREAYVVPPPGVHRNVGEYKCPLKNSDKEALLEVARIFFLGKALDVIFDKSDERFNSVVALGKPTANNSYVSYVVTTEIVTSPIQGAPCKVLVRANCLVGPIIEGRRNLNEGRIVNDSIIADLMINYRAVISDMENRKISNRPAAFGRGLFR